MHVMNYLPKLFEKYEIDVSIPWLSILDFIGITLFYPQLDLIKLKIQLLKKNNKKSPYLSLLLTRSHVSLSRALRSSRPTTVTVTRGGSGAGAGAT